MSYVVMSWLGSYGRLGNQMFQYALMVGIAKRTGLQIQVNNDGSDVSSIFDIERNNAVAPISRWFTEKEATEFTPDVEHLKYAGGNLGISCGYFQSENTLFMPGKKCVLLSSSEILPYYQMLNLM